MKNKDSHASKRIIVVDDDRSICRFCKRVLNQEGYTVETFSEGKNVIKRISEEHFDLVLSDLQMPQMDGIVVLEKVKEISPETDVIIMTGFATIDSAVKAIKYGASNYIPKPIDIEDLKLKIKECFQKKELTIEVKRLKELDKLKTEFVSNVSHELRTPLTSIRNSNELLLEDDAISKLDDKSRTLLEINHRNAIRMGKLVEDLLGFARMESGKLKINKQNVSLLSLINEAIEEIRPASQEKKIKLANNTNDTIPEIEVDPDKLKQVLVNLLNNAIKFTPEGGSIVIDAIVKARDKCIEISIEDTGVGIAPENQGKIFDRFYQVDGSMTRKYGGMGLGLAIVKNIIEGHDGKIRVESKLEKGSKFILTIPYQK